MPFQLVTATVPGDATWAFTSFTTAYAGGGSLAPAATNVVIAVDTFWPVTADGGIVLISVVGVPDATAISFASSWDGSGNLTITANAGATAGTSFSIVVLAQ